MPSELNLPFISHDPKVGDPPSRSWASFATPKLRRFPHPHSQFEFLEWLGGGLDGMVVKVSVKGYPEPFVLKLFFNNEHPEDDEEYEYYWAFERECINAAILELIQTSVKCAINTKQPINLNISPTTRSDAIQNLGAFSTDPPSISTAKDNEIKQVPTTQDEEHAITSINRCLGWLEMNPPPKDLAKTLTRLRNEFRGGPIQETEDLPNDRILCIAYAFVPTEPLDEHAVISQLNFLHLAGFSFDGFEARNWLGKGVLVDFSDIKSYHIENRFGKHAYANYSQWSARLLKQDIEDWNKGLEEKRLRELQRA